jgi:hypothetical protein
VFGGGLILRGVEPPKMEEVPPREAAVRDMAIIFNNDRGLMKMVEHQMTYSPERKKQWSHNDELLL